MYNLGYGGKNLSFKDKVLRLSFWYILLIVLLAGIGTVTLYSAANGNWEPWAVRHLSRFGIALLVMFGLAMIDIR